MKISLIGLPASGKGYVARIMSQHLACPSFSIGDLVRNQKILPSEIKEWRPLADDIAVELYIEQIWPNPHFIVDGIPRNLEQLSKIEKQQAIPDLFIYLRISPELAKIRYLNRIRHDSSEEIWNHRLALEKERMPALLQKIKEQNQLIVLNTAQTPAQLNKSINRMLVSIQEGKLGVQKA